MVDVGGGKKVEEYLSKSGFDIKIIREINPRMTDRDILKIAVKENRMVITMDKDFGELVYNSGLPHSGVLLLRLETIRGDDKVKIVSNILKKYSDKLYDNFCVFQNGRIRIKKRED